MGAQAQARPRVWEADVRPERVLPWKGGSVQSPMKEKSTAIIFCREFKPLKIAEVYPAKWGKLYEALADAMKNKVESVIVHSPEVLGDTYEELVTNLSAIASHGMKLLVLPPEEAGYKVSKNPPGLST